VDSFQDHKHPFGPQPLNIVYQIASHYLPTWRPLPGPAPAQAPARHWPLGHRRFPPRPTTLPFGRDVHRTAYNNEITELDVALTILALIDALYNKRGCTTSRAWPTRRNQVVRPVPGQYLDVLGLPSAHGHMDCPSVLVVSNTPHSILEECFLFVNDGFSQTISSCFTS
jgi:hypothetical protein